MSSLTSLLEEWSRVDPIANATYQSIQHGLPEEDAVVVLVQTLLSERHRLLDQLTEQRLHTGAGNSSQKTEEP